MNSLSFCFYVANNVSERSVPKSKFISSLASFQRYILRRVESKWFVLLSSYTYQGLIRFKFVTEMPFVAQSTKQVCIQKLKHQLSTLCVWLHTKSTTERLVLQFEA